MKRSLLFLSGLLSLKLFGQMTTWQGPEGFASDRYYKLTVNGQPVPVYDTPIASYAVFDFSGLQDNQTVYIEGGAVVQGHIFAKGKKNIHICGRGILDGTYNNIPEGEYHRGINLEDCENITIRDVTLHNGTSWQIALFHTPCCI